MTMKTHLRDDRYRDLFNRFMEFFEEANVASRTGDRARAQIVAYDALEYAWKCLAFALHGTYGQVHLPDDNGLASLKKALRKHFPGLKPDRFIQVLERHAEGETNPDKRVKPRYVRASANEATVKRLVTDLRDNVAPFLVHANHQLRVTHSAASASLLDGRFLPDDAKPITSPIWGAFNDAKTARWHHLLSDIELAPEERALSQVGPLERLAINPFGEIYPDRRGPLGFLPGWSTIRRYVMGGGIWLNAGGWPFFYWWDAQQGVQHDAAVLTDELFIQTERAILRARMIPRSLVQDIPGVEIYAPDTDPEPFVLKIGGADSPSVSVWRPLVQGGSPRTAPLGVVSERSGKALAPVSVVRYGFGAFVFVSSSWTQAASEAAQSALLTLVMTHVKEQLFSEIPSVTFVEPWP